MDDGKLLQESNLTARQPRIYHVMHHLWSIRVLQERVHFTKRSILTRQTRGNHSHRCVFTV